MALDRDEALAPKALAEIGLRLPGALAEAERIARSASPGEVLDLLTPALALIAPSGFSQADREEWLAAAVSALAGTPADILADAIRSVRAKADHPAKLVSLILAEVGRRPELRRNRLAALRWLAEQDPAATPVRRECVPKAETDAILAGIGSSFERDQPRHRGRPREPTEAETSAIMDEMRAHYGVAA